MLTVSMNQGKAYCGLRCKKVYVSYPYPSSVTYFASVLDYFPEECRKLYEENIVKREFRLRQLSFGKEKEFDSITERSRTFKPHQSQTIKRIHKTKTIRKRKNANRSSHNSKSRFRFTGKRLPKILRERNFKKQYY